MRFEGRSGFVRWLGVVLVGVAVLAGAACGDASKAVGAGDDVDFCTGYEIYDTLPEPHPDSKSEAVTWADGFQRILDRIDRRKKFENLQKEDVKPSPEAMADVKKLRSELIELRDALRKADGAAEVRKLVTGFADNADFRATDERLTQYYRANCSP